MKNKVLFLAIAMLPATATAAIPYRVERTRHTTVEVPSAGYDNQAFARGHRFYAGAMYNLNFWQDGADDATHANGKTTSGFEGVLGVRAMDTLRFEGDYIHSRGKWDGFSLTSDIAMVNAIFDARIDNLYRMFYGQTLVPYVGVGGGIAWHDASGTEIKNDTGAVMSVMAGVGIEMGEWVTADIGYRYMYMFTPKFDAIADFAPRSHTLRAGVRVNF